MPGDEFKNDHDALTSLITEFRMFRAEVNGKLEDIKDNVAGRLNKLEETQRETEKRLNTLEIAKTRQSVAMGIYISIGIFVATLLIYHIIGK